MRPSTRTASACAALLAAAAGVALAAGQPAQPAASPVDVAFQEWPTPTSQSFPHDPAVAPDGSAWYTGMRANLLGRLDPATGKIREYKLPTENTGPHGIVADREGNIWYTGNYSGLIGKLDPRPARSPSTRCPTRRPATRTR